MVEIYILVKQDPKRPKGEVTIHGATDKISSASGWFADDLKNEVIPLNLNDSPRFESYQWIGAEVR